MSLVPYKLKNAIKDDTLLNLYVFHCEHELNKNIILVTVLTNTLKIDTDIISNYVISLLQIYETFIPNVDNKTYYILCINALAKIYLLFRVGDYKTEDIIIYELFISKYISIKTSIDYKIKKNINIYHCEEIKRIENRTDIYYHIINRKMKKYCYETTSTIKEFVDKLILNYNKVLLECIKYNEQKI